MQGVSNYGKVEIPLRQQDKSYQYHEYEQTNAGTANIPDVKTVAAGTTPAEVAAEAKTAPEPRKLEMVKTEPRKTSWFQSNWKTRSVAAPTNSTCSAEAFPAAKPRTGLQRNAKYGSAIRSSRALKQPLRPYESKRRPSFQPPPSGECAKSFVLPRAGGFLKNRLGAFPHGGNW